MITLKNVEKIIKKTKNGITTYLFLNSAGETVFKLSVPAFQDKEIPIEEAPNRLTF